MNKKLIDWYLGGSSLINPVTDIVPYLYYDNGSSYMASDGSQWTDRMNGVNIVQGNGIKRPTYNASGQGGKPYFSFDGSNDDLQRGGRITQLQNISGLTIWAVLSNGLISHNSAGSVNYRTQLSLNANLALGGVSASGSFTNGTYTTTAGTKSVIVIFDGTLTGNDNRLKMYINGTQQTLSFTGTIPAATENQSDSDLLVGRIAGGTAWISGNLYEFAFVTRAITATEATRLSAFLSSRYSL